MAMLRHLSTLKKRLKLTREILESLEYEDIEALRILDEGFPLAGEIDGASVFQKTYKPALSPWPSLKRNAAKRSTLVLSMPKMMALGDKIKWNLVQQSHCVSDVNDRCTIHTKLDLHMMMHLLQ